MTSGHVKNHLKDTTDIDHMFVVKPSARQVVVASLKVILFIMFVFFVFLAGGMFGAHQAANDPEFVKEYLELKADGYEKRK